EFAIGAFAQRPELIGHAQKEFADGFHALRQRRGLLMYAAELFLDMRVARGRLKRDNGRAAGLVAIDGQNTGANQYGRNRHGHESSSPN
ncbi:MAG: hypothetical protein ACXWJ2_07320, partial [Hyphomicrobium sp.]